MRKIYCRKCGKRILTDRQPYRGIGKPRYTFIDGYVYSEYEHLDCNFKGRKPKSFKNLCNELNKVIK